MKDPRVNEAYQTQQKRNTETDGDRLSGIPKVLVIAVMILVLVGRWLIAELTEPAAHAVSAEQVKSFSESAFTVLNGNQPSFTREEIVAEGYEFYSELDYLGRCGYTMACLGREMMPTGERGSISSVKPSGWMQAQYDIVDGGNLYNRCHLIGWQLSGEDANKNNLITGTRYMNVEGMLPFENMVADYIKETGNHVMYRATPVYEGEELVARGVQLEAWSVEDHGAGICFHVYVYNVQPGIVIDYATGESWEA